MLFCMILHYFRQGFGGWVWKIGENWNLRKLKRCFTDDLRKIGVDGILWVGGWKHGVIFRKGIFLFILIPFV